LGELTQAEEPLDEQAIDLQRQNLKVLKTFAESLDTHVISGAAAASVFRKTRRKVFANRPNKTILRLAPGVGVRIALHPKTRMQR
jgi:hypothetical protein